MPDLPIPLPGFAPGAWRRLSPTEKALQIAAHFCDVEHVHEEPKGSNRGPWIDAMLEHAQTDIGQPWCAAFCWLCVTKAGISPRVVLPAAVKSWKAFAQSNGRWVTKPKRGRLFVLPSRHIGFVAGVEDDGSFRTIEGNSNDEGSREGYEVCRRVRSVDSVSGFIDLDRLGGGR
jgi:hypothetical protein